MQLSRVPVSQENAEKASCTRAGEEVDFHLLVKLWWIISVGVRSVLLPADMVLCPARLETPRSLLMCDTNPCVGSERTQNTSAERILSPQETRADFSKATRWCFEVTAAAFLISLTGWECYLLRQHRNRLPGTFLDGCDTLRYTHGELCLCGNVRDKLPASQA